MKHVCAEEDVLLDNFIILCGILLYRSFCMSETVSLSMFSLCLKVGLCRPEG